MNSADEKIHVAILRLWDSHEKLYISGVSESQNSEIATNETVPKILVVVIKTTEALFECKNNL